MTRSFNLIPAAVLARRRARQRVRAWIAVGCIYGALTSAGIGVALSRDSRVRHVEASTRTEASQRAEASRTALLDAQSELAGLEPHMQMGRVSAERPNWSILLAVLSDARGDAILLNSCGLRVASPSVRPIEGTDDDPDPLRHARRHGYELELNGAGLTQADVTRFALRLERLRLFHRVSLLEMNRDITLGRSAISFRILGLLKGEGGGP